MLVPSAVDSLNEVKTAIPDAVPKNGGGKFKDFDSQVKNPEEQAQLIY